jgi:glutathione peroxidase
MIMKNLLVLSALGGSLVMLSACGGATGTATMTVAEPSEAAAQSEGTAARPAVVDHTVETLEGETLDLRSFRGRPMLIVNTASKCGYTPQYESLQKLHETYGERGLAVLGFPSNDFGNQEPGTAGEIGAFCRLNYGVSFPMMAKVHTKGPEQAPLYRTLTSETGEGLRGEVRWNFTKFLVDAEGRVVARFEPAVDPMDPQLTSAVEKLLPSS